MEQFMSPESMGGRGADPKLEGAMLPPPPPRPPPKTPPGPR